MHVQNYVDVNRSGGDKLPVQPIKHPRITVIQEENDEDDKLPASATSLSRALIESEIQEKVDVSSTDNDSPTPLPLPQKLNQDEPPRLKWSNQWEFMVCCISMSVGLGNIWRFPVTVYKNGGGAFLIPYFIIMIVIGRPVYFLELCLGQFTSRNQVQVWRCVPFFKGVGVGTVVGALCSLSYYVSIVALPIYYLIRCFQNPLPWTECKESWAGVGNCNGTHLNPAKTNRSLPDLYFKNEILQELPNIEDGIGSPEWRLSLCLAFSWLIIYLSISRGVKTMGKVAYVTCIFPSIVLVILLIIGLTLPGAWSGIRFFMEPKWDLLYQPKVWYNAAGQCFFSLNTGLGAIIMFASYNKFSHNIYRDSLIFSLVDTFISVFAAFTTFAILGNLAEELGVSIDSVVGKGDLGLIFVTYPNAIAKMNWAPQLIAALFFLMLFFLGLGSSIANAAAISVIFCDYYSYFREHVVTLSICIIGCSIGLVYVTPGGQFILQLVDFFTSAFFIFTMSSLEVIGVAWFYGIYNFIGDIEFMLGIKLGLFWKICWGVLAPFILMFILVYSLIVEKLEYNGIPFPSAAKGAGWMLAVVAIGCFVTGAIHAMRKVSAVSWMDKLRMSLRPQYGWGPRDPKDREDWQIFISTQDRRSFRQRVRDRFQNGSIDTTKAQ
ncbi:sodium-dependent nutrient amino acid transporter 1-like [Folsomia candida]|uniref:sodium-dependent nutrient amino acid transporter 1-like n=1 Tax=Folsomia candida TaxID=158441 RepID=UPI0016051020|nr:sodium-dependent nutrient amino acid transporter 1-like [Folsomia candida]